MRNRYLMPRKKLVKETRQIRYQATLMSVEPIPKESCLKKIIKKIFKSNKIQ